MTIQAKKWFPLTWRGCIVVATSMCYLLFTYYGQWEFHFVKFIPLGDHVLRVTAIVALSLGVLSVLSVSVAYIFIRLQLRNIQMLSEIRLECSGEWQSTGFALSCLRWMPFIDFSGRWSAPAISEKKLTYNQLRENDDFQGREKICPVRRGYSDRLQRHFIIRDILRFSQLISDHAVFDNVSVLILPISRSPLDHLQMPYELITGEETSAEGVSEGDRLDIRQYLHGDSARHILWRVAAKTGGQKLYVRVPEKVGEFRVALFFLAGKNDKGNAEFVRYVIENDSFGKDWMFGTSTSNHKTTSDRGEALKLLAASGTEKDEMKKNSFDFSGFETAAKHAHCSICVLFIPIDEDIVQMVKNCETLMPSKGYISVKENDPLKERALVLAKELSGVDLSVNVIALH